MTPTALRLGVMDSQRERVAVTLPVLALSSGARLLRALKWLGIVSGVGLVLVPVPLLHLCGAITALVVGPITALFAFRAKALVGPGELDCVKCAQRVAVPNRLVGWPARVQCLSCKAMLELTPDAAVTP